MSKNKPKKKKKPQDRSSYNHLTRLMEVPFSDRDDLTLIDGILPQTEMALNSIGIHKYSDFKNYSPESLSTLLQQRAGIEISAESIENQKWNESALLLADKNEAEKNTETEPKQALTSRPYFQDKKSDGIETEEQRAFPLNRQNDREDVPLRRKSIQNLSETNDSWDSLTSDKSNKKESADADSQKVKQPVKQQKDITIDKVTGIASSPELKQEAAQQYSESLKKSDSDQTDKLDAQCQNLMKDVEEKITLKIIAAQYHQAELHQTAEAPAKKIMHGEISCNLTGKNAFFETQYRFSLFTQIHAVDVETEQSELMAAKSFQLTPRQNSYRVHLEFDVPEAGYYRLNAVAFLLAPEPKIDFREGPFLRVIPEQHYIR